MSSPGSIQDSRQPQTTVTSTKARLAGRALAGITIGLLSTFAILQFKMQGGRAQSFLSIGAIIGAAVAMSRFRRVLWWFAGTAAAWIALIAFTPLAPWLVGNIDSTDQRGPADAVIVLGCGIMSDGTPTSTAEDRLQQAARIVREGDVRSVVLCGVLWKSEIRRQLQDEGVHILLEWSGPVANTHDEALATARLAKEHGWKRVIVVTQAWHMRRAAAVFRSAGLEVLQSPALETRYDLANPEDLADRLQAVRDWIHEAIGFRVYRMRGWIR